MADQKDGLMYKGHPLMRKDNIVYYGSMADKYIVILQVLESKDFKDLKLSTKVSVQLQLTDQTVPASTQPLTWVVSGSKERCRPSNS